MIVTTLEAESEVAVGTESERNPHDTPKSEGVIFVQTSSKRIN